MYVSKIDSPHFVFFSQDLFEESSSPWVIYRNIGKYVYQNRNYGYLWVVGFLVVFNLCNFLYIYKIKSKTL